MSDLSFLDVIKTDCSEYLQKCKTEQSFLLRGIKIDDSAAVTKFETAKPRKRCETDHDTINDVVNAFLKKRKLPTRAGASFATTRAETAKQFGNLFYIFPCDDFSFCYAELVVDLYPKLERWLSSGEALEKSFGRVRNMISDCGSDLYLLDLYCDRSKKMIEHVHNNFLNNFNFKTNEIEIALREGFEIWFHGSYYAIPVSLFKSDRDKEVFFDFFLN